MQSSLPDRIRTYIARQGQVSMTQLMELSKGRYETHEMHEALRVLHTFKDISVKVVKDTNVYSIRQVREAKPVMSRYRPSPTLQAEMDAFHADPRPWWWPWESMENTWDDLFKTPDQLRVEAWNRERELVRELA